MIHIAFSCNWWCFLLSSVRLLLLLMSLQFHTFLSKVIQGGNANKNKEMNSPGAISSFSPGGQYIMLTFDGGPHSIISRKILQILKDKNVHATFFVSGHRAIHHKDILLTMHKDGHELANNGWSRDLVTSIYKEPIAMQIRQTSALILNATNYSVKYFRPFQGNTNLHINEYIRKYEYLKVVLWSLDSKDVEAKDHTSIVAAVVPKAKPGDIVLFHDTKPTVEALPIIIDGLIEKGYEFLTLSQVASFPDDSPHR